MADPSDTDLDDPRVFPAVQEYLRQYYTERAGHRANHARRISGRSEIRFAEAFQRELPQVVDAL